MRAPSHYRWLLSIIFLVIQSPLEAQTPSDNSNATTNESRRIVILTFDDSAKTHFTFVRPILLKYGFGGTFFITEGWDFATNKRDYMTWEEIAQLSRDGFEIGNHTRDHMGVQEKNLDRLEEQLDAIAQRCKEHNIPKPITFAWPGNSITPKAFPILQAHGIQFARRGGVPEQSYESGKGFAFEPGKDHPLLLPSAGDAKPQWELANFVEAVEQANQDHIAILQFHGVPDTAHAWVSTEAAKFEAFMHYLALKKFQVEPLRYLSQLKLPPSPENPMEIIEQRRHQLQAPSK
ncbi:MAG: polysaccharide deacetylase family protein [Pirellulales bacterium]